MSKMKDIYVIKVKTRPPLSSLYPSERRYSASTVGGLSLVHLGLSILAFLLGTLARSLQGPVLSFSCLVPFISGLLAWRRWYIDRNISIFFYGSLFSLVVSILCGVATVFDIASMTESGIGPAWKIENIFSYPAPEERLFRVVERNETYDRILTVLPEEIRPDPICNETFPGSDNPGGKSKCPSEGVRYFDGFRNGIFALGNSETRTNILLDINVLVTCVLEISWSLLSLKISLRGMRNRVPDSYDNGPLPDQTIKSAGPNPTAEDQFYSRDDTYDDSLRNIGYRRTSVPDNSGPRLPLPESNKEFRERVERFLANQAAHRIVEGSCS